MKTIYTSLPIYNSLSKQCFERGRHAGNDKPIPVICPRHRLPAFQWLDGTDENLTNAFIEMIGSEYDGTEETLITDWASHSFDHGVAHTGLSITEAHNVGAGVYYFISGSITVRVGDLVRIRGHMSGSGATYPTIYFNNDAGWQHHIFDDTAVDMTLRVRRGGTTTINIAGVGAIDFTFTGVTITRVLNIRELYWYFPTWPTLVHDRFSYSGETLNYLLDPGDYYLKITGSYGYMYYSDWFRVECVYPNLINVITNNVYEDFHVTGTEITLAEETGTDGSAQSNYFTVRKGEEITVILNLLISTLQHPDVYLQIPGVATKSNIAALALGLNVITLTSTYDGDVVFWISNFADALFSTSEIIVIREYSPKYLIINFFNTCDLGDILYHHGFTQTIWFESETMEPLFVQEEEGMKNGQGQFIRSFARQVKKYVARTMAMPDYMVDVFNRMKLHDSIQLIDLVGNVNTVYNMEVEHEYLWTDKYYVKIDLTFDYDEAVVIAGCCNNIT